jgi:putative transposase
MSDQFWLTKAQLKRIEPFFPRTRGIPRVDDRRVVSGIVHVIRNGLRWRDAPAVYGPHKTLYNRFVRSLSEGPHRRAAGRDPSWQTSDNR